eukprot:scaffold2294_cov106-Cylindrotheca_fusiformis.AAC.16
MSSHPSSTIFKGAWDLQFTPWDEADGEEEAESTGLHSLIWRMRAKELVSIVDVAIKLYPVSIRNAIVICLPLWVLKATENKGIAESLLASRKCASAQHPSQTGAPTVRELNVDVNGGKRSGQSHRARGHPTRLQSSRFGVFTFFPWTLVIF